MRNGGHIKRCSVCRQLGHKRNICPSLLIQGCEERPTAPTQQSQPQVGPTSTATPTPTPAPTPAPTPTSTPAPSLAPTPAPTPALTLARTPALTPAPTPALTLAPSYGIRKMRPKMQIRRPCP